MSFVPRGGLPLLRLLACAGLWAVAGCAPHLTKAPVAVDTVRADSARTASSVPAAARPDSARTDTARADTARTDTSRTGTARTAPAPVAAARAPSMPAGRARAAADSARSAPTAVAPPVSVAAPPPPLALPTGGYTVTAARMLGQEDVGGVRHVLEDVTVTQKGAVLTAPRGYYYAAREVTTLGGGARMRDSTLTVTADSAAYGRATERLDGYGDVVLVERDVRLKGDTGSYERLLERGTLHGHVFGTQAGRRFSGDKMVYERRIGLVVITGHAVVVDSTHDSTIRGERILYNTRTRLATALERPSLDWTQGKELMQITGERMRFQDDGNRLEVAGGVVARQGRQTVTGDSAVFLDDESTARIFGNPRVADAEGTLTGDSLTLAFREDRLDRAVMKGRARLVYLPSDPDLVGERSVVTGDSLTIYFVDDRISHLVALGHPTTDYTPSRADSAQGTGRVSAGADSVRILLKEQAVDRVELAGGSSGTYVYRSKTSADSVDTVRYQADRITFLLAKRLIHLVGAASTEYHELTLKADKIDFDAKKEMLTAEPHPILIDRGRSLGEEVQGKRVSYDLRAQRGTIYHGYTKYDTGFLFADSLRKVSERELNAADGNYTTCDLAGKGEDPHFHFTSRKMKVFLGDKVVAKPVALYIGRIPIFALPFYVFSLRHGRHSGLLMPQFNFGFSSGSGRFFENLGYYWAASDYTDYTFKLGYRERPGVLIGEGQARYVARGRLDGQVDVGHAWGEARGLNEISIRHNQTLGPDFRLTGSGEFADPEFRLLRGLGTGIGDRVDRQLRSNFGLSRSWRAAGISLNVTGSQEKALDASATDGIDDLLLNRSFPTFSASLSSRSIGRKETRERPGRWPWASTIRYGVSVSGSRLESQRERTTYRAATDSTAADTTYAVLKTKSESARWNLSLLDSRKILGWLNLSPSFSLTESWVDREFTPTDTLFGFRRAAVYSVALSSGTSLYGTISPNIGPLRALRHTLSPNVSLVYNPDFKNLTFTNALGRRISRFPGVSAAQSQNLVYSVENRFQAKVKSGDNDLKRLDLFSWRLDGRYDLLAAKRHESRPASNIGNTININQIKSVGLDFRSDNDPYHQLRFQSFSMNSRVSFSGVLPGGVAPAQGETARQSAPAAAGRGPGFPKANDPVAGRSGAATAATDALNWSAGFGLSYGGSRTAAGLDARAQLNSSVNLRLSPNWNLSYGSLYAFKEHEFNYQRIELKRDLHCWEAMFTYSATPLTTEFYFRISVKALPEIKFEQGPGLGATGALGRLVPTGGF